MANGRCFSSSVGFFTIYEQNGALVRLAFGKENESGSSPLLAAAVRELEEYFAGVRQVFDLPLAPKGTVFQQRVWHALQQIPYGQTASYKQLAAAVGNPLACRAVGGANNKNPLPIFIPCHRVIGTDGKMVGYAGGLKIKQFLLELEQKCR